MSIRKYNPVYFEKNHGKIKKEVNKYANRPCFDMCQKKKWNCNVKEWCDTKTYCTPLNFNDDGPEMDTEGLCDPPSNQEKDETINKFLENKVEKKGASIEKKKEKEVYRNIEFRPKRSTIAPLEKSETLRTMSSPGKDYKLFKTVNFNGLKIMYVGSIYGEQGVRDIIIVEFPPPYILDVGGREKKTQVFYRSTGKNSGVRHSWFPMNGIVSPRMWWDKGGKLKGPKKKKIRTLLSNMPNWKILNIDEGGDSPLFAQYGKSAYRFKPSIFNRRNIVWEKLKNIVGRFSIDKFMEISLILGGGELWEQEKEGSSLRNSYFKNKHLVKKMYDIPSTRIKLSPVQINSIIGRHTEYGLPLDINFFIFQNKIEPFGELIQDISSNNMKEKSNKISELQKFIKTIEERYKKTHNIGLDYLGSFSFGSGNSVIPYSDQRSDIDIGLPSGNIYWMYSAMYKDERSKFITLGEKIVKENSTPIRIFNMDGYNNYQDTEKGKINLTKEEPGILGKKTWKDLSKVDSKIKKAGKKKKLRKTKKKKKKFHQKKVNVMRKKSKKK